MKRHTKDAGLHVAKNFRKEHAAAINMFKRGLESNDSDEIDNIIKKLKAYNVNWSPDWVPGTVGNIITDNMPDALEQKKNFLKDSRQFDRNFKGLEFAYND